VPLESTYPPAQAGSSRGDCAESRAGCWESCSD